MFCAKIKKENKYEINLSNFKNLNILKELNKYNLSKILILNLSNNKINFLHPIIYKLINLEELILDNNNISFLSSDIKFLTKLTKLSLNNNLLFDLPNEISKLNNLKILEINNNKFTKIPTKILYMLNLNIVHFNNYQHNIFYFHNLYNYNLKFNIQNDTIIIINYLNKLWNSYSNNKHFNNFNVFNSTDYIQFINYITITTNNNDIFNNINKINCNLNYNPYATVITQNIIKFKPYIKFFNKKTAFYKFICNAKLNLFDLYFDILNFKYCISKKLIIHNKSSKKFLKNYKFFNISPKFINLLFYYFNSNNIHKKYVINHFTHGNIISVFKSNNNDISNPYNFRFIINYSKFIKIIDTILFFNIIHRCKFNININHSIFKSDIFNNFNYINKLAVYNTQFNNNILLIDIEKAFDSVKWSLFKKILFINLSRKVNSKFASNIINQYFNILSNSKVYYKNFIVNFNNGIPCSLISSKILFNFFIEEIILLWLFNLKNIIHTFKINVFVDDIFIQFFNTDYSVFITQSLINHLHSFNFNINTSKFKISPNLNNLFINHFNNISIIQSNDFYLGIPFTRNIKLYANIILLDYQHSFNHSFNWSDIYNILLYNHPASFSILGYLKYKLSPFLPSIQNHNLSFIKPLILNFILKFFL